MAATTLSSCVRSCRLFVGTVVLLLAASPALSQTVETKAKQVYMVEQETGTVLLSREADTVVAPASNAKLMTMDVALDAIKSGTLALSSAFPVSEYAWRTGGAPSGTSTMFAAIKSSVPVSALVTAIAVQFANDACLILAEGLAGSEGAFVEKMNARARALGLAASRFANATGLPDPRNQTSMRDLVTLARHLQETYPDFYSAYALPDFEWNKIRQRNRNPLIAANIGVDGLVTGFAEGQGFSIVASMAREGRRVFLAAGGFATDKERTEESRKLLDWAMTDFARKRLFEAGETVAEAPVYGGAVPRVALVPTAPVDILLQTSSQEKVVAEAVYHWPLKSPVAKGAVVGRLVVTRGGKTIREVPLEAAEGVEEGPLTRRAADALQELLFFWL
ncbi:D-alanyl-D-alanine carboxypeptidase [Xaviernesmea oryzae]|uniref:serine-type D-Ala-D-Ala carboxypeptidase n=1 Tax=Xaviernesmea oryzae TaxID=464029 RepID=A0A1Q9AWR7_9HYPH|nr:D-alanyl-D-alanine carboxypeptidase family protein [Xaviernesmea oryzae]OLP59879.1 D-alanyl-D-alanine carboxypeptidase [Xaviernesmea oryzae]SEK47530.1 D-alanyl-D-alanine carboxypeptidase (penicillin-binding protein 5/6) [Xaviernesmea oryzae]